MNILKKILSLFSPLPKPVDPRDDSKWVIHRMVYRSTDKPGYFDPNTFFRSMKPSPSRQTRYGSLEQAQRFNTHDEALAFGKGILDTYDFEVMTVAAAKVRLARTKL